MLDPASEPSAHAFLVVESDADIATMIASVVRDLGGGVVVVQSIAAARRAWPARGRIRFR